MNENSFKIIKTRKKELLLSSAVFARTSVHQMSVSGIFTMPNYSEHSLEGPDHLFGMHWFSGIAMML